MSDPRKLEYLFNLAKDERTPLEERRNAALQLVQRAGWRPSGAPKVEPPTPSSDALKRILGSYNEVYLMADYPTVIFRPPTRKEWREFEDGLPNKFEAGLRALTLKCILHPSRQEVELALREQAFSHAAAQALGDVAFRRGGQKAISLSYKKHTLEADLKAAKESARTWQKQAEYWQERAMAKEVGLTGSILGGIQKAIQQDHDRQSLDLIDLGGYKFPPQNLDPKAK